MSGYEFERAVYRLVEKGKRRYEDKGIHVASNVENMMYWSIRGVYEREGADAAEKYVNEAGLLERILG